MKHQGSAIVVNPEKDSTMVNELLEFKQKIDEIMKKCFENNRILGDAVHDAFKYFINIRKNRPAELIAKHVDQMMRSGNKGNQYFVYADNKSVLKLLMILNWKRSWTK